LLSTGMCSEEEISEVVSHLETRNLSFGLMNCVSEYPPKIGNPNYKYVKYLKKKFNNLDIGHSDHSPSIGSSLAAITIGASIIEKHVTLNSCFKGPDSDVSITFDDYELMIKLSEDISNQNYLKGISNKELKVRSWAYRGLVANLDLKTGDKININSITSKRPSLGIPSNQYLKILGKKINTNIKKGVRLKWEHFEE